MLKADSGNAAGLTARELAKPALEPRTQEASIGLVMIAPISFALNLLAIIYLMR